MPPQQDAAQSCPQCGHSPLHELGNVFTLQVLGRYCPRCGALQVGRAQRWQEPTLLPQLRNTAQALVTNLELLDSMAALGQLRVFGHADPSKRAAAEAVASGVNAVAKIVETLCEQLGGGHAANARVPEPDKARPARQFAFEPEGSPRGRVVELVPEDLPVYLLIVGHVVELNLGGELGRWEVSSTDFPKDLREPDGYTVTFVPLEFKDADDLLASTWSQTYSRDNALRRVAVRS